MAQTLPANFQDQENLSDVHNITTNHLEAIQENDSVKAEDVLEIKPDLSDNHLSIYLIIGGLLIILLLLIQRFRK